MGEVIEANPTTFDKAYARADTTHITTPYGTVSIADNGRRITFTLFEDVRQSIHHKALFSYYQQLQRRGIHQINVDHLDLPHLDRTIRLQRGKHKLDMAYKHHGKVVEIELKTHREIGIDATRRQLEDFVKHCQNLIVVVPRRDMEEMKTVLAMINLDTKIQVDTYEISEDEEE